MTTNLVDDECDHGRQRENQEPLAPTLAVYATLFDDLVSPSEHPSSGIDHFPKLSLYLMQKPCLNSSPWQKLCQERRQRRQKVHLIGPLFAACGPEIQSHGLLGPWETIHQVDPLRETDQVAVHNRYRLSVREAVH